VRDSLDHQLWTCTNCQFLNTEFMQFYNWWFWG